ncbi:MAG: hypothetical protein LUI12_03465 [Clostridiales bacterium]|nr:hypothetical protein [Clostridiales bacterium]
MTNTKRNYLVIILFAVIAAVAAFFGIFSSGVLSASAETVTSTSYLYWLNISGTGISTAYLYSDSSASTATVVSDGVIFGFSPSNLQITIRVKTGNTRYYSYYGIEGVTLSGDATFSDTTDYSNNSSSTKAVTYSLPSMGTGYYTLTINSYVQHKLSGNSSKETDTTTFSFYVDKTAPTISGASTSTTGKYTNSAFTVTATDSGGSGVSSIYMKEPNSSSFNSVGGSSKTVQSGSANGLYSFYAIDNAGNQSSTYYVYYDNTAPTLSVSGGTFGSATGTNFTVSASDVSGSATTLYYRKGSSGSFTKASSTSYTVSSTAGDDDYYFYAVDTAGNKSSEYVVTLSTTVASGSFVKSDTNNTVFFYWTNSLWTATLDGKSYTSGTWITDEGTHTIVLTSPTTGSKTYSYTIDHYYEEYQVVEPTCTSQGYTIYRCSQCGDTYKGNYTDKAAHTYITTSTAATCTEQGYTTYTCTKCGDSYKADYTEAKGHTYETTVVDPTCTEQGYTIYHCVICGDTYYDDYTETIAHSYQSVYVAPTCTEGGYMEYTCVNCGDTYSSEISLPAEHSYTITVIRSATCTETGLRHYCCDNCGYEYDVEIPATGHNYVITNVENNEGDTIRTYQCDDCGDSYTEDLGNQAEYVASYVEYLFELYSDYIWWLLLATVGVWSIVMGVFFAIATKNEDKQKARKMVINYLIGLVAIAVILVAAPLLAYGIAVLVT